MCYSAQVNEAYDEYVKAYGANVDIETFWKLYGQRVWDPKVKIPKGMDVPFLTPKSEREREIKAAIEAYAAQQTTKLEQEIFKQRKRLADAERSLLTKSTKKAADDQRIATSKIEWAKGKLADLNRTDLEDSDSRIYPGFYAPVMVFENGQKIVRPMRYQCRPTGKPVFYDTKYPGTYNARRDNLEGFWKGLFGHTHGIMIVSAFYEHVERPDGEKVILEFKPRPLQDMLVACLWSKWSGAGEPDLYSFAAITDGPPAEVAAAGHDRCIIPIKAENVDAWLNPDPNNLDALYAILDDRERPYYEHRLAA